MWGNPMDYDMNLRDLVVTDIQDLHIYYRRHNWKGIDPYDFLRFSSKVPLPFPSELIYYIIDGYIGLSLTHRPLFQKILNIKPHLEAKALAVFARAYIRLTNSDILPKSIEHAALLCETLWHLRNKKTNSPSWGLSFPWRIDSKTYLPPNSPTALITALAGLSFLELYQVTSNLLYLERAKKAASYLLNELGYTAYKDNSICFWYCSLTRKNIFNANAMVGYFLNNLGREIKNDIMLEFADRSYLLLINNQSSNGGWNYFVDAEPLPYLYDNYHTGFIIESLLRYEGALEKVVDEAINKSTSFYRRMFDSDGAPIFNLSKRYPIDIHDVAQGLLVFSLLHERKNDDLIDATRIWRYANEFLRKPMGTYISRIYQRGKSIQNYPRWADAWMMFALAQFYLQLNSENKYNR